ncbi:MAG: toll/interleukin-1 receptor domain-containing protein, partial [Pseudomonadota bacterium]|nr:toll/interleukin-1 receptor domain-containing protein [Pseudomonadota bacterium]
MVDVFISYKREDRARVQPLVDALTAEGLSVWWDVGLQGGAAWRQGIETALDGAKCVIVAWSALSIGAAGEFVHDEASRARGRGVYLPVRIDPVDPPLGFGQVHALSLIGWKGRRRDPLFQQVLVAARALVAGVGPAAAVPQAAAEAPSQGDGQERPSIAVL